MGLDSVELVMAFEEEFGITIADSEAAPTNTPGKVIDMICGKLALTAEQSCQTQRAFYLLRRAIKDQTGSKRKDITLDTPLKALYGSNDLNHSLAKLGLIVDARNWPSFRSPLHHLFPLRVKHLVPYVVSSNQIKWTRDDVAKRVKHIVIEQLGLKEHQYREDADFINELGMD